MNLKVANLVAVQFGMFIGIMSWLAYSQVPFAGPRTAAKTQASRAEPAATVAPAFKPGEQRSQTVDYQADREEAQPIIEQPAPAMHEYSTAAVQQYSALAAQQYYQQIAPRRHASSGLENRSTLAEAPSDAEVEQEPALVQPDDSAPHTVAYDQPTQVVVYPQPQFVVFSNQRRLENRCRPTPHRGAFATVTHRRHDRGGPRLSGSTESRPTRSFGVVHRRNDSAPSCQPTLGFGPQGKR